MASAVSGSNEVLRRNLAGVNVVVIHRVNLVVLGIADQHERELISLEQVDTLVGGFRLDEDEAVYTASPQHFVVDSFL